MNEIVTSNGNQISVGEERSRRAYVLHNQIMTNGFLAAQYLLNMCRDLKTMHDEKLYTELEYESFGEYCDKAVGIGERQGYTYIRTYEKLGADIIADNANLGITKLSLLVQMNPVDRIEALEGGELENMSAREVKELVERSTRQSEQLSLITDERDNLTEDNKNLEDIIRELKKENAELKQRPIEISSEPTEEKLAELKAVFEVEFKESHKAEIKEAVDAEKAKVNKKIQKAKEEGIKEAEANKAKEIADAVEKAKKEAAAENAELKNTIENYKNETAKLEKELKAADTNTQKVLIYMQAFQDNLNKTLSAISTLEAEQKEKLTAAVKSALTTILKQIGG